MRRVLVVGLAAVALMAAAASPAWAHSGVNASKSLRSEVVSIPRGVQVEVAADGSTITVSSRGTLVVLGYDGERFLRLAGDEVVENANSLTTYDTRPGLLTSIPRAAGHGPTRWQRAGAGSSYTWSDRRTVWDGAALPAAVMSAPKRPHVVSRWEIPVVVDGIRASIMGRIVWVPPTDSVGLTVAACLGVLVLILAGATWMAWPQRVTRVSSAERSK